MLLQVISWLEKVNMNFRFKELKNLSFMKTFNLINSFKVISRKNQKKKRYYNFCGVCL